MAYDNNNRGALFRNKEKKSESSPLYTGSAEIGGMKYKVSAWVQKAKSGESYMSLAFKEAQS